MKNLTLQRFKTINLNYYKAIYQVWGDWTGSMNGYGFATLAEAIDFAKHCINSNNECKEHMQVFAKNFKGKGYCEADRKITLLFKV